MRDINTVAPGLNDDTDASIFGGANVVMGNNTITPPTLDALALKQKTYITNPIQPVQQEEKKKEEPHCPIIFFK